MSTLLFIIVFQAVTIILLLSLDKSARRENVFLIRLLAAIALYACFKISLLLFYRNEVYFDKIHGSFSLLYGPLLYFFAVKKPDKKVEFVSFFPHLIPFTAGLLLNLYLLLSIGFGKSVEYLLTISDKIMGLLVMASLTIYSTITLSSIRNFSKSEYDPNKLKLVQFYAYSFLAFILFDVLVFFVLGIDGISNVVRYVFYLILLSLFFMALIYYIRSERIAKLEQANHSESEVVHLNAEKYRNSTLSEKEMSDIVLKIDELFKKKEPFLDHEFCLDDLAIMTGISKSHITQALNVQLKKSFYQLVNERRIEKSIHLVLNDRYTDQMQIIAAKSGFKSKTTFYKYFKEYTGTSPLEYKKSLHNC